MDEFVSTFTNRLDAKGRVSIPAPFRAILLSEGADALYCCPTLDMQAVDAGGARLRAAIRESLAEFARFSPEHEDFSTALFGVSELLKIDGEGRVVLTDSIKDHAGITSEVTFVGQGYKFQIWEPKRFAAFRDEARARVRDLRNQLGTSRRAGGTGSGP